jgi:hypothetical protein
MTNVFFIVGCQRSGTTMLEAILNAHPKVHVVGEEKRTSYKYLWNEIDLAELSDEYVGLRIPAATHQVYQAVKHEGARVLFCLRDPRDVATSMLRTAKRDLSWLARQAHGEQGEIKRTMSYLADRADMEKRLEQLYEEIDDQSDVRFAAFLWALKNRYIPMYAQSSLPTKVVRYEVLVSEPEAYLPQICDHLGLEWSDHLLEHGTHNTGEWGGTDKTEPIHGRSIEAFRDRLSIEDRRKIHRLIQLDMEMHGYVELFD